MNKEALLADLQKVSSLSCLMELWKRWDISQGKKRFIYDGIVNPAVYDACPLKVCFLMEECYFEESDFDSDPTGISHHWNKYISINGNHYSYDLVANLREERPWYMYHRVAYITKTILKELEAAYSNEAPLQSIAVLNMKKSDGVCPSDLAEIKSIVSQDRELIQKELELLDPDVIVCGRITDICLQEKLFDTLGDIKEICSFKTNSGFQKAYRCGNKIIFDMWHPSAPRLSYEKMSAAFAEKLPIIVPIFEEIKK